MYSNLCKQYKMKRSASKECMVAKSMISLEVNGNVVTHCYLKRKCSTAQSSCENV